MPANERRTTEDNARRLKYNELLVLQALSSECECGFEVMGVTGISAGSVYPVLRRLEASRYLSSRMEDEAIAHTEGRPPRRVYALTESGRAALIEARQEFEALHSRLGLIRSGG